MASVPADNHVTDQSKLQEAIISMMQSATAADKLNNDMLDSLLLFMDPSSSQSNVYLSETDKVRNANNVTLSGEFRTIVQKGSYANVGHMIIQMSADLADRKIDIKNIYAHYDYCPQCSTTMGHNYTVLFAEVNKATNTTQKGMEVTG